MKLKPDFLKRAVNRVIRLDLTSYLLSPITVLAGLYFLFMRKHKLEWLKINRKIFTMIGIYPIMDHYYDPLFNPDRLQEQLVGKDRELPGLDLNVTEQLDQLSKFHYSDELKVFPMNKRSDSEFHYQNGSFQAGDAEYLYSMIRHLKPSRIIEVGCGNSTLLILSAIKKNKDENSNYTCSHTCIEPYESAWLEKINIHLIRKKVEDVPIDIFQELGNNDILFIDSSHIIRPQGDVLFEYQNILPNLKTGVYVHIHDIFTPKDYLPDWGIRRFLFWNEQYLLESFLTFNKEFKVVGALNYLKQHYFDKIADKCPILSIEKDSEPTSFWIKRN